MIYIYIVFLLFFGLLAPKLFCFLYLVFRYSASNYNNKKLIFLDCIVSLYLALSLSKMLADRPYYIGEEAGFGQDMMHYYNAFEWVGSVSIIEFFNNYNTVTALTGSAEPVFWLIVKFITLFFSDGYSIHFILTLLSCLLIYLSGQVWNKCGILFLFFYTNTITFFAFQGSAIRSGLAFSLAMLGYALVLKNKSKILSVIPPFVHFSMIPLPIITYASTISYKEKKKILIFSVISILLLLLFFIIALRSQEAGLGAKATARLAEDIIDLTSIIQFFSESIFTMILVFFIFKNKVQMQIKKAFIFFFIICCLLLLISPSAFSRFYRYEYIFMIYIYSSIFIYSKNYVRFLLILFSILWLVFLGFDRYVGVFGDDIFDFLAFNLFYRFN